jgi:hypothetical protein
MEIYQKFNENEIEGKLHKIKNSIYTEIKNRSSSKKFESYIMGLLSEIWDLKNFINLEAIIVNLNFN